MAARTALVVRQPTSPPAPAATVITTTTKRRGGRSNRGVALRQAGWGLAGAAASAATTAALCMWFGFKPQNAGLIPGAVGAVGAFAAQGPKLRPFAVGAAVSGGAVALSSWIGHFSAPPPKRSDEKKDPSKDQKQLSGGSTAVVASPPTGAKNANPPTGAKPDASAYREASSVSDAMRAQIRQAMRDTRYRG